MAKERRKMLLPFWGYVLLNVLFLATMLSIYFVSTAYSANQKPPTPSVGLFPILMICYISFTLVSIFDAVYDRIARSQQTRRPDEEDPTLVTSSDRIKKGD